MLVGDAKPENVPICVFEFLEGMKDLFSDFRLDRPLRHELFVLDQFRIFVNDRVQYPASAHAHALRQIVEVLDNRLFQADPRIKMTGFS